MFHVAAGSDIVETGLSRPQARTLAFRTHQREKGRRQVRIVHSASDRIVETYERCDPK